MLEPEDRDGCAAGWTELTFKGVSGLATVTMKVNLYPTLYDKSLPSRFWQLRNYIEEIGFKNAEGIYKIVRTHIESWRTQARMSGLLWSDSFRPSRTSAVALKTPLVKCSPEFETSTALLLTILTNASQPGTSKVRTAAASSFFQAFVKRTLVCNRDSAKAVGELFQDDALELCGKNLSKGKCEHMNAVDDRLADFRRYSSDLFIFKAFLLMSSYVSVNRNCS